MSRPRRRERRSSAHSSSSGACRRARVASGRRASPAVARVPARAAPVTEPGRAPGARSVPARDGGGRRSCPARWLRTRRSRRPRPHRGHLAAGLPSTRSTAPRPPPSRRPGRRRTLPPGRASRAASSRASRGTPPEGASRRSPSRRAGRRERAARCRRASSRSAEPSRRRRRCSARTRPRAGHRCPRSPLRAGFAAACRARPGTATARSRRPVGTWARRRIRRCVRRTPHAVPLRPERARPHAAARWRASVARRRTDARAGARRRP